MKIRSGIRPMLRAAESFFTTWALMKASRMEPGNVLTLFFFLFSFIFYRCVDQLTQKADPSGQKSSPRP